MSPFQPSTVTVVKASAGSGKTYALTMGFLQLLLNTERAKTDLRNIIALTFSNNAAAEMRERILQWLKELALQTDSEPARNICKASGTDRATLARKAHETIEHILNNYTDFQVKTIDSFMTALFRATSIDFGLTEEFDILMDNSSLFAFAFEALLREVAEGTPMAKLLEDVIDRIIQTQHANRAYLWDPSTALLKELKNIYRKITALGANPSIVDRTEELSEIQKEIKELAEDLNELIVKENIRTRPSWSKLLQCIKNNSFADMVNLSLKAVPVLKTSSSPEVYELALQKWQLLKNSIARYALLYSLSYYQPYLTLLKTLMEILEETKRTHARIFIEDINYYMAEYLRQTGVPDIYFLLGEKIYHWFIDEFQDTSAVQWRNLKPLIENSLAEGGTLFVVGDTKQSIYSFREADYRIMKAVEEKRELTAFEHKVQELDKNYRSRKEIVAFSARLFKEQVGSTEYYSASCMAGLDNYIQKAAEDSSDGYVEVVTLPRDNEQQHKDAIVNLIKELLQRGYRASDIAVLSYRNQDILQISAWLNEAGIPFLSYSSLDIRKRKITSEITSLLRFLDSPINDLAFCSFILGDIFERAAEQQGVSRRELLGFAVRNRDNRPLYRMFREEFPELWSRYFEDFFRLSGYLPLYDMLASIYYQYRLFETFKDEEATLARLLEVVKELETREVLTLSDFLRYMEEDSDETLWTLSVPADREAVKVMTIHKAKGLGFPVTILFLYENRINRGFPYIWAINKNELCLLKINRQLCNHNPYLEDLYRNELLDQQVNSLNTLYVGLTRAEEEMYIMLVGPSENNKKDFPLDILPQQHTSGVKAPRVTRRSPAANQHIPLNFSSNAFLYETEDPRLRYHEKKRGDAIHTLLQHILFIEEDTDAQLKKLKDLFSTETLSENEIERIFRLITDTSLYEYFRPLPSRKVYTEQEFVDKKGRLYRVDRIVIDPHLITVIDFKTGTPEEKELQGYRQQLNEYLQIVREVFHPESLQGLIVLLDHFRIIRVGPSL